MYRKYNPNSEFEYSSTLIYPPNFEHKIGFADIRADVANLCISNDARRMAEKMPFRSSFKAVGQMLRQVAEMVSSINSFSDGKIFPTDTFCTGDYKSLAAKLRVEGAMLTIQDFMLLMKIFRGVRKVMDFFGGQDGENDNISAYPELYEISSGLCQPAHLISMIDRVFGADGEIRDNASEVLMEIRGQLRSSMGRVNSTLQRIMSSAIADDILEKDTKPVMREGRLVLPLAAMHKRALGGIVHGESASGRTVFVEPAEIVQLNNRIKELEHEEKREIAAILSSLTQSLKGYADEIENNLVIIVRLDFIHAKAEYAARIGGQLPNLSKRPEIEWYHAVSPILSASLEKQGKAIVPLDIRLSDKERIMVISGPNAGGKSVALKTVGLIQYMMQCGLLPPLYSNSHMGMFDSIFIDIGDNQSIEDDLSTYSSHLANMKRILTAGDNRSLVLIDEFGAGTEPTIGGALAEAILRELHVKKCWAVITTHYQNLKRLAEEEDGMVNGSMLFDRREMLPLFQLSIGTAGSSFALEIARKAGLPQAVINKAVEIVGQDYVDSDKFLLDINRDKKYWEKKRYDIRQREKQLESLIENLEEKAAELKARRKELIDEARKKAEQIVNDANANIERTIMTIKEAQADKQRTRDARLQLEEFKKKVHREYLEDKFLNSLQNSKKRKKQSAGKQGSEIRDRTETKIGDLVQLDGKGMTGEVLEIKAGKAVVGFGLTKMTVDLSRLSPSKETKRQTVRISSSLASEAGDSQRQRKMSFRTEIDLRGMRADEALQAVVLFVDDAIQYGVPRIRILHGTGTGALRQTIRQYLTSLKEHLSFADEDVRLGGAGITVVTFH